VPLRYSMRPPPLFWLQLLLAATAAAAAEPTLATTTASPSAAAPAAAAATLVPTQPAAAHPLPLASLFLPQQLQQLQMRAMDGGGIGGLGGADAHAVPWLASLARSFPSSLRALDRHPTQSREAVSAIEQFSGPLVRFATGGQPVAADVEQLIDSIPHLARSATALKEADKVNLSSLDITSMPSNLITHVLNGGEIPGIDRAELDRVVREHLKRMSETADRLLRGEKVESLEKILPPLSKVPMEMVMTSLQGKTLPGLTAAETAKIREYYTKQLPSHALADADTASPLPETLSALGGMVQLLPPGYDIGRIPPEFIESIMASRVPDLSLLPPDLQDYFNAGKDEAMTIVRTLNSSVAEIVHQLTASLKKMPEVTRAEHYDISKVTHEVIDVEANKEKQNRNVLYTIAWVVAAAGVAAFVAICLLYRKFADPSRRAPPSAVTPPARDTDALPADSPRLGVPIADDPASPRRRYVASTSPDAQAKVEFAAKTCRFSTPKPQLVLNSPELAAKEEEEEKEEQKQEENDVIVEKEKVDDVSAESDDIYDDTTQ
ncbi:hypothetical protein PENTCL1PPCAC_19925, partial [Pristionchus entomophagus]